MNYRKGIFIFFQFLSFLDSGKNTTIIERKKCFPSKKALTAPMDYALTRYYVIQILFIEPSNRFKPLRANACYYRPLKSPISPYGVALRRFYLQCYSYIRPFVQPDKRRDGGSRPARKFTGDY